ncbi:MAG: anhydro-N-acetylmuramic acid kinase [Burkholderiaceae bacterium]
MGVMTGTSMDGIDLALIRGGEEPQLVDFLSRPMSQALVHQLHRLQTDQVVDGIDAAAQAGLALSIEIADGIQALRARHPGRTIAGVGVHGQTIRHRPSQGYSLQLLHAPTIAERTGLDVVYDFRNRDVAAGGQGAPLVPIFHAALLRGQAGAGVLNLGGIANLTVIKPDTVIGFDTGPGNTLLDAWAKEQTGHAIDAEGRLAASGQLNQPLLAQLLADAYFALPPPKSTGRDHFHLAWLAAKASGAGLVLDDLPPDDVQRTLVELTARSVAAQCPKDVRAIYVCGGGVHNPVLMQALSDALGCDLLKTDALGWPSQSIEAAAFAWLAQACVHRQPGNLPSVTGAAGPRILGSICPA